MKSLKVSGLFGLFILVICSQSYAQNKTTREKTRIDTAAVTGGVVVDTTSKNNPEEIAKNMATNLMFRINLSMEQAEKVSEILKEYQEDIAGAETKIKENKNEEVGGNSKELLSEIDNNANQKIEDVLENNQLDAYSFIKNDWWNQVKEKIYNKKSNSTGQEK